MINLIINPGTVILEAVMAQWHKRVIVNGAFVGSFLTRAIKLLFINTFIFFALVTRQTAALSSHTQHAMPQKFVENGVSKH